MTRLISDCVGLPQVREPHLLTPPLPPTPRSQKPPGQFAVCVDLQRPSQPADACPQEPMTSKLAGRSASEQGGAEGRQDTRGLGRGYFLARKSVG